MSNNTKYTVTMYDEQYQGMIGKPITCDQYEIRDTISVLLKQHPAGVLDVRLADHMLEPLLPARLKTAYLSGVRDTKQGKEGSGWRESSAAYYAALDRVAAEVQEEADEEAAAKQHEAMAEAAELLVDAEQSVAEWK